MTIRRPHPRSVLVAAGLAMAAANAGVATAEPQVIRGIIEFETGEAIPEGLVEIHVEGASTSEHSDRSGSASDLESDGKSKALNFSLPVVATGSRAAEIVARLERADGWLIARGSVQIDAGAPVRIVLYRAVY